MTNQSQACIACGSRMEVFIERIWDDRYGCPGVFSIFRCIFCEQMVTAPRLTEADLPALYSTYYPRRDIDFDALEREAGRVLLPGAARSRWLAGTDNQGHYLAKAGQQVLDIGSGSCLSLLELRNMDVQAFGVEADPNVRLIADRYGLDVHIGSIHDIPFPGLDFDLITLNQVIEHVPDPQALLRVVFERLRPGGRVVLSFPNSASLQRRLSGSRWINWHVPYHQHHFNKRSFALLAHKEGYVVEHSRSITPNLWTILQLRAMGKAPAEGASSDAWCASAAHGNTRPSFALRVRNGLMGRMRDAIGPILTLFNRLLDQFGAGDSLLVVLKRRSDA